MIYKTAKLSESKNSQTFPLYVYNTIYMANTYSFAQSRKATLLGNVFLRLLPGEC